MHRIETETLELAPVVPDDAGKLFSIFSDPRSWWYDPGGRHLKMETTVAWCERAAELWARDGLSYWTARELHTNAVTGVGGAQRQRSGNWNINYRIAAEWQRRGLANELSAAAKAAALRRDPTVAIIAWVAEHNLPSRRVAERAGLVNRGPHIDPSDNQTRLAYSDRPLDGLL